MRLILASASPRRAELLRAAGFEFDTVVTDVDESIRDGESPASYVRRLAAEKSYAALKGCATSSEQGAATSSVQRAATSDAESRAPSGVAQDFISATVIILGADTAVVVDGEILGKPRDDEDAAAMLGRLSGRRHEVMTGISLRSGAYEVGRVEVTAVQFAKLSEADIAWYVASGEGRDKAGAYAIQGLASRFIPRIEGSYSNVVGLPVSAVYELITEISDTPPDCSFPSRSAAD